MSWRNLHRNRVLSWLVRALLLSALCACGDNDTDETRARLLIALEMVPAAADLPKGLTQTFKVVGTYADEHQADVSAIVHWQSSAPEVASVDAMGLVRARVEGSTFIGVSYEEPGLLLQARTELRVTPAVVQWLVIGPDPAVSGVGLQLALKAMGTYSDGTTADVTALATWVSESPAVVEVQRTTGISTGVALGSGTVRAAIGPATTAAAVSIVANTWTSGGDAPYNTSGTTVLADGRVLTEATEGSFSAATLIYDPASRSWSAFPPYLSCISCTGGSRTLLASGLVLGTGGMSSDMRPVSFASAKHFDPASGRWTRLDNMQQRRYGHAAIRLANGTVLVVGGAERWDGGPWPQTAEIFDPVSATWSWTGSFSGGAGPLSLLPDGKVLKVSGSQAELYDPVSSTWSPTGSSSKSSGTVTQLRDGKVLETGGSASVGGVGSLATAEIYDPATGTWAATASMARRRQSHAATLLADGRVMVSGGRDGTETLASTEIYDPRSDTWSSGPPLLTARSNHSARLLGSGVVVVMGGNSGPPTTSLRSVELYW